MQAFPHRYTAAAKGEFSGSISVQSPGVTDLTSKAARQFGGPGDAWSPEALLVAALADCFIFTFRSVTAAALFGWRTLECSAEGVLDKHERAVQFTHFTLKATLTLAPGADAARARRLLRQADRACLIASSLKATRTLVIEIIQDPNPSMPSAPSLSGTG